MAKKKFNFIDVLIVVFVVAAVAATGFMYHSKTAGKNSGASGELTFTVEVTEVDKNYMDAVSEGDRVIFGTSSSDEAQVVGFEFKPAEKMEKNEEQGTFVLAQSDELFDAFITLKGTAAKTDDDIKIGSTAIKTGDSFEGKAKAPGDSSKAYLINGYVLDMSLE